MRGDKDTLALGNITGAMVFQSTFPVSIGLLFTALAAARSRPVQRHPGTGLGHVFYVTLRVRHTLTWWSLAGAGSMYAVYLVYVLLIPH